MYESYWNMTARPFSHATEPVSFFRSKACQSALLRLNYAVSNLSGPCLVLGQSGTGKSSLVRYFASEHTDLRPFVHVVFPALQCDELLRFVQAELTEGTSATSDAFSTSTGIDAVLRGIRSDLRRHTSCGRRALLFFDDAHLLSDDALQFVIQPLLSLAESDANLQLVMILSGQPALAARLRRFGQISERIAVTTPLNGFSAQETRDYVISSLKQAGASESAFSDAALQRLYEVSSGNPRRINRLCDMALLVGFAERLSEITPAQIDSIACELLPAA